jgi:hypothetical protein
MNVVFSCLYNCDTNTRIDQKLRPPADQSFGLVEISSISFEFNVSKMMRPGGK